MESFDIEVFVSMPYGKEGATKSYWQRFYTDDQIFEAIVSAAVGAGLFRLETVLHLLHSNHTEAEISLKQLAVGA